MSPTPELIAGLRKQIRRLESNPHWDRSERIGSGCAALDRLLPGGGLRRGTLVEWLQGGPGSGAATLALQYARAACRAGGALLVVDRQRQVYPPALAGWGIDLSQVVLVYPRTAREEIWVWDQGLRSAAVGAVWGEVQQIDGRSFRRLQLAVEDSGGVGLFVRPRETRRQPTWADLRLLVEPQSGGPGRRVCVHLLHCRGAAGRGMVQLEFEEWSGRLQPARDPHETRARDLVAGLARATAHRRSTGT